MISHHHVRYEEIKSEEKDMSNLYWLPEREVTLKSS